MNQLWHQGGWVLLAIVICSTLGWAMALWKWLVLRREGSGAAALGDTVLQRARHGELQTALSLSRQCRGAVGRVLTAALSSHEPRRRWFERQLQPLLEAEREAMRRHLSTIAILATILPLLGLLGTVLGMQQTFTALMQSGSVHTASLAGGISRALVTTQAGLITALPLLLLHGYLRGRVERELDRAALFVKQVETLRCTD